MLFTLVYVIARSVLGLLVVLLRRDLSKDTELLVLRHENAVLAAIPHAYGTSRRTRRGWPRYLG